MRMYDIIVKKRDGYPLAKAEIDFFVHGYANGEIPDYQASALLMAIYFQGMDDEESAHLTMAMARSGDMLDLSEIDGVKVDKHSSGGVGDKTTLCLIPLVASCGVPIPKMSGRGLGHTGGTIDKLEAIEGFNVEMTKEQFIRQVNDIGLAIIGQSENLAPADKKLYSLRDVTATVNSIPLIASSIMSKKIASGADKIVLDVKVGSGAFMKDVNSARKLAKTMVEIGKNVGKETVALLTNMDEPLGFAIGNALEVKEAILALKGEGPKDLTELMLELGAHMVVLGEKADSLEEAKAMLKTNIENGKALQYFKRLVEAQGGNAEVIDTLSFKEATYQIDVFAKEAGYVAEIAADELGRASMLLGAGRRTKDDVIDLSVGLYLHKKVGDRVTKGEVLCTIHANDENIRHIKKIIENSIQISVEKKGKPLIIDVIK
ncbi:MAG: pyrimidine-nucleoside phosphorylase [Bacilli bacterium]|nr:pyrimidine-nucleoside phosphorylase [Bacilli bacterium]